MNNRAHIYVYLPLEWRVLILAGGESPLELRAHTVTSQLGTNGTEWLRASALTLATVEFWLHTVMMYSKIFPRAMAMSASCRERNVKHAGLLCSIVNWVWNPTVWHHDMHSISAQHHFSHKWWQLVSGFTYLSLVQCDIHTLQVCVRECGRRWRCVNVSECDTSEVVNSWPLLCAEVKVSAWRTESVARTQHTHTETECNVGESTAHLSSLFNTFIRQNVPSSRLL